MLQSIKNLVSEFPYGGTVNPQTGEVIKEGFICAVYETQDQHGEKGMLFAYNYAIENGLYFGWWLNEDNGLIYFDAVLLLHNENACKLAVLTQRQICGYCIHEQREVKA